VKSRLALIATALVGACAGNPPNDGPYAVFEPGDYSAVRKEIPVQISAIDGESPMTGRVRETVKPGKRVVDLYLPTRVGPHSSQARQIVVEAQPCTRYRIVAYYDNLVHVEWQPVVYDEPIGECRSQFGRPL
jgi:hypothetical protein